MTNFTKVTSPCVPSRPSPSPLVPGGVTGMGKVWNPQPSGMAWDAHIQGSWWSVSLKCAPALIRLFPNLSLTSELEETPQRCECFAPKTEIQIRVSFPKEESAGIAASKSWKLPEGWLPNTIHWSLGSRVHWGTIPIYLLIFVFIFHNKMLNMNYGYSALNCNKSCIFHLLGYSSLSDTLYCLPEYFYKVFASFNL